jgi:hypothetical protein
MERAESTGLAATVARGFAVIFAPAQILLKAA